jgi:hypothetical protein
MRLMQKEDVVMFSEWAVKNFGIPAEDHEAVGKTAGMTLVVEDESGPIMSMPVYLANVIGFLNFRPGISHMQRARAMKQMLEGFKALNQTAGIEDSLVFTEPDYPMGKWALKHGFQKTKKSAFLLRTEV